ncbi:MAG: hypothetical protein KKA42_02350, partial [candidate division Zixibacteria bacterium]|nr:hypothetical protein [candidate division Zixibacteria bacterium]
FQVFFVSSTGRPPEKIGTDVGRSLYRPPAKMSPIGVREPFYWLLNSITRNRSVSRVRTLAKYVAVISTIWCVAFSIPFLAHFMYLKPKATSVEDNILEPYKGNILNTTSDERAKVISAYSKYERSWMVRWLFPKWQSATMRAKSRFTNFDLSEEIKRLDQVTGRFTQIVNDSALWPQLNPADLTLIQNTEHETLLAGLNAFHQGDETSELYTRSDRVLQLWELFTAYITSKGDSTSYATIQEQVQFNRRTYDRDLSAAEKALGDALAARLQVQAEKKQQKEIAKKAAVELDTYVKKINKNDSPAYRLGDAVAELRQLRKQLDPSVDGSSIAAINDYIDAADTWKKTRKYTFKVQSVPGQGHLHIEVTPKGQDPTWGELSQIIEGYDYSVNWKVGDNIHLALDTLGAPEEWGKTASARKILTGNYSLFNMDGEISFDNLGLKVSIEFSPPLAERLPELEK